MMPVAGECSALVQRRLGSIAIASAAVEHAHALDAVRFGAMLDAGQHRVFLGVGGDDQLAAIAVRDALLAAIGVQHAAAGDAEPRHQTARGIVDAGVDHLAVAR